MGQQINQLNDKEKDQRRLSRGEEKSNVNNNSKNFGMVKLQVWALTQFFYIFLSLSKIMELPGGLNISG